LAHAIGPCCSRCDEIAAAARSGKDIFAFARADKGAPGSGERCYLTSLSGIGQRRCWPRGDFGFSGAGVIASHNAFNAGSPTITFLPFLSFSRGLDPRGKHRREEVWASAHHRLWSAQYSATLARGKSECMRLVGLFADRKMVPLRAELPTYPGKVVPDVSV
jgi:hypothetical protein